MSFKQDIDNAISPYIKDTAARAVVRSLLEPVRTVDRILRNDIDDEARSAAAQILLDFTIGLNSNPFWMDPRNSGYIMPVYSNAVVSWLHSFQYAKQQATPEEKLQYLVARNVLVEVAVAVLYCERGAKGMAEDGPRLREAIMKLRI